MSKYIAEIEFEGEKNCWDCILNNDCRGKCWLKPIPDSVTDTEGKPYKNVWDYLNKHWVFSQKEKPISSYTEMIYELLKRNNSNYEYAFHDVLTLFQDYVHIPNTVTICTDNPMVAIQAKPLQEPVIISSPIAGLPEPKHSDIMAELRRLREEIQMLKDGECRL